MSISRSRLVAAVTVAVLVGVATYLLSTVGMRAMRFSDASAATGPGHVPEFVYAPPETVPTTKDYGPVGPVSMVFAGTKVLTGLTGRMDRPWIAVSSQTGDYRALSVPHRPAPAPGAVSVSPDGTALAWGYDAGVVLYDPVDDEAREVHRVGQNPSVGAFSRDGRHLAVYDNALRVLDVESGTVVATLTGVGRTAADQAVWTPDGTALNYVEDGRLVTHDWKSGSRTTTPTTISAESELAWQPSGRQLAAMQDERGVKSVEVFDVTKGGRLEHAFTVGQDGYAQQELLGFVSDTRVTVSALRLETGTLPYLYQMSTVDTTQPAKVMQLSGSGIDWETLRVAVEPLANGSAAFEEPKWPASDLAKLVGSILVTAFALGLYLTRRPRRRQGRG